MGGKQSSKDLILKYFSVGDSDTNYLVMNPLQNGYVPDISGESYSCLNDIALNVDTKTVYEEWLVNKTKPYPDGAHRYPVFSTVSPVVVTPPEIPQPEVIKFKWIPALYDVDCEKTTRNGCAAGYTLNDDGTQCILIETQTPTANIVTSGSTVGKAVTNASYSYHGARVYDTFNLNGSGVAAWNSTYSGSEYWSSKGTTSKGKLNNVGVWVKGSSSNPVGQWIGCSKTVNVPVSKIYYVGMAGDNLIRFKVNGQIIVSQSNPNDSLNFQLWHIYPVFLNAGMNIIEMEGYNSGGPAAFGAEIYNCTLADLQAADVNNSAILNIIFSTADEMNDTFTDGYTCANGYALDVSGPSPICRKISYGSVTSGTYNTGIAKINTLLKVSENNNEPMDDDNKLVSNSGKPQSTKPNVLGSPDYVAPLENFNACPLN